jgi:hypothetical protein
VLVENFADAHIANQPMLVAVAAAGAVVGGIFVVGHDFSSFCGYFWAQKKLASSPGRIAGGGYSVVGFGQHAGSKACCSVKPLAGIFRRFG